MNDDGKPLCALCQCTQTLNNDIALSESGTGTESCDSKCSSWLQKCNMNDDDTSSELSYGVSSSIFQQGESTEELYQNGVIYDQQVTVLSSSSGTIEHYQTPSNVYQNLALNHCKNIVMGNITKVYGTVNVVQNQSSTVNNTVTNNIFLNGIAEMVPSRELNIVDRKNWVGQPPIDPPAFMQLPAKLVIISHTATENAYTQAENVLLVRNIQVFHVESRKWNDIGYNYLIGCDGKTYEGRGWGVIGAHAKGYNHISVGISFIGCFLKTLPSESALDQAKTLIKHGVEIGAIDKDYTLLGHCQCCPTESPGRRLFEEIQTWDHWKSSVPA